MKNKASLKWIIGNSRPVIPFLFLSTVISAAASGCMVLLTYVGKQVVDIATGYFSGNFFSKIFLLVVIVVLELIFQVIYSRLSIVISGKMEMGIKTNIFSGIPVYFVGSFCIISFFRLLSLAVRASCFRMRYGRR